MSDVFVEVARKLGLTRGTSGVLRLSFVHGVLDGVKVRARWGDRGYPVEALIDPPLDLGLDVQRVGVVPRVSVERKIWLYDSNWDMEVDGLCDEPLRANKLLEGDARRAVLGLNATHADIAVNDESVGVFVLQADEESLERAFRAVARTAKILDEARRKVPPAKAVAEHAKELSRFADAKGLGTTDTPLAAWGELGEARLQVAFPRTGFRENAVVAHIGPLEGSLGPGLLVRRETMVDRVRTFLGGQDLKTGDAVFDPAFLVQAAEAERALAALDGDARALLLDLRRRFQEVTLDDQGLTLRAAASRVPAGEIGALLEIGCAVVESVARASGAVRKGAYR